MGAMKIGGLERYSAQMGRLVERHLAEAALIAARQEAEREAFEANRARQEIEVTAAALRDEVSVRERAQARLAYLASHDTLTSLPNRAWFNAALANALRASSSDSGKFAVLYIDLDNFKDVNDTLGHEVGDALLQQVAARIQGELQADEPVARIGGDEFAIILPNLTDATAAEALGNRLVAALCRNFDIGQRPIFIGASIGISLFPTDARSADELLRHADLALYRAKNAGRNRCHLFDQSLIDEVYRRALLEQSMREPGLMNQLQLVFQPQIDLYGHRVSGVETLLRWQHPEHGWIRPQEFIPVAERSGLILAIGNWVLRESCRQAARWRAEGRPPLTMSVNISALQFQAGDVPRQVAACLEETGLPANCLELEITETAIMNHANGPVEILNALHEMGVGLAIDDFGTGYSSLSYLRQIPVDRIKIDQSFIRDAPFDEDAAVVAKTIVQLAHSLRLQVVAEGVENRSQLDFVRQTGCRFAQGYFFSKALDGASLVEFSPHTTLMDAAK